MKFMLMLMQDSEAWEREPQSEKDRTYNAHMVVYRELEAQKKLLGSTRLRPSSESKTVRLKNGKPVAIDGPFSETKEVLGGSYLIECASMDEAVGWAMKMPHFGDPRYSGIEIRPIWE
jgi:hypothetical protein